MKKIKDILLIFSLILIPNYAFAISSDTSSLGLIEALFMEGFITIHMSFFVLLPLSKIFSSQNYKNIFIILFTIRILILLYYDFFITTMIALVDFFAVFIGAFLIVPISGFIASKIRKIDAKNKQTKYNKTVTTVYHEYNNKNSNNSYSPEKYCSHCGNKIDANDSYCSNCGAKIDKINKYDSYKNDNSGPIKESKKFNSNW